MTRPLRTTRPVCRVETIADIEAIEAAPMAELITARNLYDLFLATEAHVGDRPALTVLNSPDPADVGLALSHAGLRAEIARAANLFRALGLSPGQGVAAFLSPTVPLLPVLLLGAQVAGVASSINYLLSGPAIADLLAAEGATLLVIPAPDLDPELWDKARALQGRLRILVIGAAAPLPPGFEPIEPLLAAQPDRLTFAPSEDPATPAALFHTGGTTGRPKLVPLSHGNQIHAAFGFAQVFGFDDTDVVLNGFPLFHVGGTMTVGLSVLAAGGHVIFPGPRALRPAAVIERYWSLVAALGVTVVNGVPTSIAALTARFDPGLDTSAVRMALTGGAVCPPALSARFEAVTGIGLYETYGMTETAAAIAFNPGRGERRQGSVGFRAPWSQTRIMRIDAPDQLCAPGATGLVQVRGPQVFAGYLDPAHDRGVLGADGWLTTGDVGWLTPDQRLVLTGREKDLIVRSGHNIDPAAIEDVANTFPGVEISAAVGMPDAYAGEVPVLFVVPRAGVLLDAAALAAHLEAGVHEPPARPRTVLLLDALPVTAVGKIFKPALRDLAIAEKVRQETLACCGAEARADTRVEPDQSRGLVVRIALEGSDAAGAAALAAALEPLPQSYHILRRQAPGGQ